MTWWQIALAIVLNVPWLFAFVVCVIFPSVRFTIKHFDEERFLHNVGATMAIVISLSAVVLFFSLLIFFTLGDTIKNLPPLPLVIAISAVALIVSTAILLIINRRR